MVDLSQKTILLVDDDKDFCFLINMMLKKTHARIKFAYNGEEAIKFLDQQEDDTVDLIMLDIQMPLISGYIGRRNPTNPLLSYISSN